eukprot:jgi/Tetstr1/449666/TSEL_036734.t1
MVDVEAFAAECDIRPSQQEALDACWTPPAAPRPWAPTGAAEAPEPYVQPHQQQQADARSASPEEDFLQRQRAPELESTDSEGVAAEERDSAPVPVDRGEGVARRTLTLRDGDIEPEGKALEAPEFPSASADSDGQEDVHDEVEDLPDSPIGPRPDACGYEEVEGDACGSSMADEFRLGAAAPCTQAPEMFESPSLGLIPSQSLNLAEFDTPERPKRPAAAISKDHEDCSGEGIQMSEDSCEEPAASDIPATQVITGLSPVTSSDDFEIVAAVREGGADPATSPQPGANELASRAHLTQHIAKPRPAQEDNAAADKQVPGEEEVVTECVGRGRTSTADANSSEPLILPHVQVREGGALQGHDRKRPVELKAHSNQAEPANSAPAAPVAVARAPPEAQESHAQLPEPPPKKKLTGMDLVKLRWGLQ